MCFTITVKSQNTKDILDIPADTITSIEIFPRNFSDTYKRISARVGAGFQKSYYTEIGVSRHTCTYSDVGFFSRNLYVAVEWAPIKSNPIFAGKLGYEINMLPLISLGLETKYQTNFKKNDLVVTPKIGLGIFGDLNVFYGYNFSIYGNPFMELGRHQISLVINFHKNFLGYL